MSKSAKGLHNEWHLRRVVIVPLLPPHDPAEVFYRSFGAACPCPLPAPEPILQVGWHAATIFECDGWLVGADRRRLPLDPRAYSHRLVVEQLLAFGSVGGAAATDGSRAAGGGGTSDAGAAHHTAAALAGPKIGLVKRLRRTLSPTRAASPPAPEHAVPALRGECAAPGTGGEEGYAAKSAAVDARKDKVQFQLAVLTENRLDGVDVEARWVSKPYGRSLELQ